MKKGANDIKILVYDVPTATISSLPPKSATSLSGMQMPTAIKIRLKSSANEIALEKYKSAQSSCLAR